MKIKKIDEMWKVILNKKLVSVVIITHNRFEMLINALKLLLINHIIISKF